MKVYGASVSYYTGKLEAYLRYKGIPYERDIPYTDTGRIAKGAGTIQHPIIERDDGRFMSDSTPMIHAFESEFTESSILPSDPVLLFIANLIEDYADEWLWRPAMHYRWSYDHDRELLSRILADELTGHVNIPRFMRIRTVRKRQLTGFVINDGVTEQNQAHVEAGYHRILALMSDILANRPFLLGDKPSIADFGLMGPMLRHFGQDPTPAEIMRDTAPLVFAWLGRMWNAKATDYSGDYIDLTTSSAAGLASLLKEISETHLVQLAENARAYQAQEKKFAMTVQDGQYHNLPVSRYRVYCLETLRTQFQTLSEAQQVSVQKLLPFPEATLLWNSDVTADSGYDSEGLAPYNKAINVFDGGVPT